MNFKTEKQRALLAASVCALLLLLPAIFGAPSFFTQQRKDRERQQQQNARRPATADNRTADKEPRPSVSPKSTASETASKPAPANVRAADAELARAITRLIDEGDFAQARWGVSIVSLRDGRTLYSRDAGRLFTPASNMKLYTTAVALDLLGADYRWRTSVYSHAAPDARGNVEGDLVLYGRGAPDLSSRIDKNAPVNHLAKLADELYRRGVRRIGGGIVGDESYFRGEPLGDGWQWNDVQWYYGAEVSALSIDDNEITLSLASAGKVGERAQTRLVPPTDYVHLTNDMNTVERGSRSTIGVTRALSSNDVRVWGDFPFGASPYAVRLSVHQPALRASMLFREALKARGIAVEGRPRQRDARSRVDENFKTGDAFELASVLSRPLGEVVRETNKESLNLQAELLLRTLGRERAALVPPVDTQKTRERNTDETGLAVVRLWLRERAGVETDALALHDGSGLSRLDLVTPEATTRLLARMAQSPSANLFRDSLPAAGRDGTLRFRLRNAGAADGRIAAKTGTLTYINSLSGYANTADGEPLAFSIFCNDETGRTSSTRIIDAIAALLASYSPSDS